MNARPRSARALVSLVVAVAAATATSSCQPIGSTGLVAKPVATVGPPASAPDAVRIQAALDFDPSGVTGGPEVSCHDGPFLAEPRAGTTFAVVDATGRLGELVTTGMVSGICDDDACSCYRMTTRWVVAPTRAVGNGPMLAIAPPNACGPACRIIGVCMNGDASCGRPVPAGLPLTPLEVGEKPMTSWWAALSVDLDGDGVADLLFADREAIEPSETDPWIEEVAAQRTGTGWVALPPMNPSDPTQEVP
jgi:hypothetical protein